MRTITYFRDPETTLLITRVGSYMAIPEALIVNATIGKYNKSVELNKCHSTLFLAVIVFRHSHRFLAC